MANNKLKIVLSILQEISNNNYPTEKDYDMDINEFGDILQVM